MTSSQMTGPTVAPAIDNHRLTAVETTALGELERLIEKGIATFCAVGKALEHIRDQRLYRESHSSFEDYLRQRWGISRSYAYRQIEAAQVSPNGDTPAPGRKHAGSITKALSVITSCHVPSAPFGWALDALERDNPDWDWEKFIEEIEAAQQSLSKLIEDAQERAERGWAD